MDSYLETTLMELSEPCANRLLLGGPRAVPFTGHSRGDSTACLALGFLSGRPQLVFIGTQALRPYADVEGTVLSLALNPVMIPSSIIWVPLEEAGTGVVG